MKLRRTLHRSSWIVAALLLCPLAAPASASAELVVTSALQPGCGSRQGAEDAVFVCDPRGSGRRIALALGPDRFSVYREDSDPLDGRAPFGPGVSGSIGGGEPMLVDETLVLDWPVPSAHAELAIKAFFPVGVRTVVLPLTWRPAHVEVTNRPDGSLEVRSSGRTDVVPAPALPQPERSLWQPSSARKAADGVLRIVDQLGDPGQRQLAARTLCAAVHPDVYAIYGQARQLQGVTDADVVGLCPAAMLERAYGLEDPLELRSSRRRGGSLQVRGSRAYVATTIINRFKRDDGVIIRAVVRPRVLLVKDGKGMWRLGEFDAVLRSRSSKAHRYRSSGLARSYRADRRKAAELQAAYDRWQAELQAGVVVAGTTQPCVAGFHADPVGDLLVDGSQVARRPEEHGDVDLVAGAFGGRCLRVRTQAGLPTRFIVEVGAYEGTRIYVDRDARTVMVTQGEDEDSLSGARVSLTERELIVRFPRAMPLRGGPPFVRIVSTRLGVEYADELAG